MTFDWKSNFPSELKEVEGTPDMVKDLMDLDIGSFYDNAWKVKNEDGELKYGLIPLMDGCSKGQIGALLAESFCERCLSVSNTVFGNLNRSLSDEDIKILVMARMNRPFLEFMRENYMGEVQQRTRQQFNASVVQS